MACCLIFLAPGKRSTGSVWRMGKFFPFVGEQRIVWSQFDCLCISQIGQPNASGHFFQGHARDLIYKKNTWTKRLRNVLSLRKNWKTARIQNVGLFKMKRVHLVHFCATGWKCKTYCRTGSKKRQIITNSSINHSVNNIDYESSLPSGWLKRNKSLYWN